MLSALLKLVILYYVVKFVVDRFLPKINKFSFGEKKKSKNVKRFKDNNKQVKDAEFDEL